MIFGVFLPQSTQRSAEQIKTKFFIIKVFPLRNSVPQADVQPQLSLPSKAH